MIARFTILYMESMYPASAAFNVPLVNQLSTTRSRCGGEAGSAVCFVLVPPGSAAASALTLPLVIQLTDDVGLSSEQLLLYGVSG